MENEYATWYPARTFGKANPGYPAREVGRSIACSMRGGQKQVQTFNFRLKWVSYRVDTIKIRKSRHLGKTVEFEWPKLSQICEPGSASRDIRLSSNFVTLLAHGMNPTKYNFGDYHGRGFVYWRSRNDCTRAYIFVNTWKPLGQIAPLWPQCIILPSQTLKPRPGLLRWSLSHLWSRIFPNYFLNVVLPREPRFCSSVHPRHHITLLIRNYYKS